MELTEKRYKHIKEAFPKQRRKAEISNFDVLNAALYMLENGYKWRSLHKEYGNWNTVYVRLWRWIRKTGNRKILWRLEH